MGERRPFIAVYMMTSRPFGPIYIGVTSNLPRRAWEHREGTADGFTRKHGLKMLVWYEQHELMTAAIQREKNLKRYYRAWKMTLIEQTNPGWNDLSGEIV